MEMLTIFPKRKRRKQRQRPRKSRARQRKWMEIRLPTLKMRPFQVMAVKVVGDRRDKVDLSNNVVPRIFKAKLGATSWTSRIADTSRNVDVLLLLPSLTLLRRRFDDQFTWRLWALPSHNNCIIFFNKA